MSPYVRTLRAHVPWPGGSSAEVAQSDIAPRQEASYTCPRCGPVTVVLATGAEAPGEWDCRCGLTARRDGAPAGGSQPAGPKGNPDVTPMAQLLKRRSVSALEALLAERLAEVRGSGVAR